MQSHTVQVDASIGVLWVEFEEVEGCGEERAGTKSSDRHSASLYGIGAFAYVGRYVD